MTDDVLTVDELATMLKLARSTAYEHVRAGDIPGMRKIGRHIRFHRDTVLAWLAGGSPVSRPRGAHGR